MKRFLIIIFTLTFLFTVHAEDNVYVYRNDGKINAFFSAEIDSMCYSNTGLDGTKYNLPVIQEIFTPDSTYRIPLAVIDSISLHKPETIYTSEVKLLNPDYTPYIVGASDLTIDFSTSMPYHMQINKGDILFYDKCDRLFNNGFAGRVVSITNTGNLKVECEPVELQDVYKQFLGFGEAVVENSPTALLRSEAIKFDSGIDLGFTTTPVVRPLIYIKDGNTYIEVTIGIAFDYNASIHTTGNKSKKYVLGEGDIPILQPFPGVTLKLGYQNYAELELAGGLDFGFYGGGNFSRTFVYDNGTWTLGQSVLSNDPVSLDVSLVANGTISVGTGLTLGIDFVGNLFNAKILPSVGRSLEFEITKSLKEFDKNKFYDLFKESTLTTSNFVQLEIEGKTGFGKFLKEYHLPLGKVKLNIFKHYLLPECANLDVKTDKKSITISTRASRQLMVPCKVGLAVFDENGNEIDSYYEDQSIFRTDVILNRNFNQDLNGGVRYTIKPMVKLFGFEMYASPEEETYLDAEVTTGLAFATTYSVRASGSLEDKPSEDIEVGFIYSSSNSAPTAENGTKVIGDVVDGVTIEGGFSGLAPGKTYFYRAYAYYNNKYYYGNTQCVTTKRNCDRSSNENIGGEYTKGCQPMASIGGSFDIEEEKAKIELDYKNVHPSSTCTYYLESDDKYGNHVASECVNLGVVTGRNTIELDNLIPGTTYRFWGNIKGPYGSSISPIGTFETIPTSDPFGTITEITDIQMEKAKVTCKFENIKESFDCGVILSDGKWEYTKPVKLDDTGMGTADLSDLLAETTYSLRTYIHTTYDPKPIEGKERKEFTTEGPDITGLWILNTNVQVYANPGPFEVKFLDTGKTNYFNGPNSFMHWQRNGRNLYMNTPTYATQVGMGEPTTCWELFGRFNDDFTFCTGYVIYRNFKLDEILSRGTKPFTLTRVQ